MKSIKGAIHEFIKNIFDYGRTVKYQNSSHIIVSLVLFNTVYVLEIGFDLTSSHSSKFVAVMAIGSQHTRKTVSHPKDSNEEEKNEGTNTIKFSNMAFLAEKDSFFLLPFLLGLYSKILRK